MEYYSGQRILRYDVPYRIIFGERSNGKTYFVKTYCVEHYIKTGRKFMYIRKRTDSVTRPKMKQFFADQNEKWLDVLHDTIKFSHENGFYIDDEDGNHITLGYVVSLEDYERVKGIPFNDVDIIFYDEFIEQRGDLDDEWRRFLNMVSTVRRRRDDVEVFLVANTITKYSTYFENFGIDINRLRRGSITYIKHTAGVEAAVEYTDSLNIVKGAERTDRYFGFDNSPASKMIMYGEWDYDIVNIKEIDGVGWSARRRKVPIYFTSLGKVYEFTEYVSPNPIIFIRTVNTQKGVVNPYIRYNISHDNSIRLVTSRKDCAGIVPTYGAVNELLPDGIREFWSLLKLCVQAKRIVYDSLATGSDFLRAFNAME